MRVQTLCCSTALAVLALGATGCTLISDLDRFEESDGGGSSQGDAGSGNGETSFDCSNPATLCVALRKFGVHQDRLVEIDLVAGDGNLRARAVLDPLGADEAEVVMPLAVPSDEVPEGKAAHELHLEMWADQSSDREYTPTEGGSRQDHDWNVKLPADAKLEFTHNTVFTDLVPRPKSIGGDFEMNLTGFDLPMHEGKIFEVMVIEEESGRTVGLYRLRAIPGGGEFSVKIPGIIDGGATYRIEFYVDVNGNETYDSPTGGKGDHAWVMLREADSDGLSITRTHSAPKGVDDPSFNFADLDYQFDFSTK